MINGVKAQRRKGEREKVLLRNRFAVKPLSL